MSDTLQKVTGSACLNYVDKPIGLIATDDAGVSSHEVITTQRFRVQLESYTSDLTIRSRGGVESGYGITCNILKIPHDINKRKIGVVLEKYDDGGLYVAILGNETLNYANFKTHRHKLIAGTNKSYERDLISLEITAKEGFNGYPVMLPGGAYDNNANFGGVTAGDGYAGFDDLLDYTPTFSDFDSSVPYARPLLERPSGFTLVDSVNNTMKFGKGEDCFLRIPGDYLGNPIRFLSGNLYLAMYELCNKMSSLCPRRFENELAFDLFTFDMGREVTSLNQSAIPFNLMLTNSVDFANAYLTSGAIPPDAFLYPLDWDNLPGYTDDQDPEDPDDTNEPGDNGRDIDPNLPVVPTFTPSMLSNYNWYWLDVSQYSDFLNWFWNDIGDYNDFDDLMNKVKGLYNDVASAVLMCRFFPVELSWIGGAGSSSNIKVGMIEKSGGVTTINTALDTDGKSPMKVRDIGHIRVPRKYKSFCDLAPYTQLSIYLPFYGFMDLDIDLFMGHDIYVKGLYDYLTGTIQYFIYYDNQMLVNTVVAKMAVDIPITLQTKNDRDSAVFQNVSSVVGGLIGAGAGIASGNPIGMALGVTQGVGAINSGNASAPLNVKGTVGETGAFYAPPKCYMILRRPTIQPSDSSKSTGLGLTTWAKNVGQLCGYGYKLENLNGEGFTVCHTPRIEFKKTAPLQSEIDEIYDYLEKGVIL